ncbi:CLUMA_CG008769, isoform A [Clunio marinus]|uniref:CLUMA_CG008769, isoform A n=1 Tax=Clunio marinus TaxID=568069 RepID=A0A1J1I4P6_9DIPT|nr:CLUMA_CG008769, isoform A [Clunio marinus]
MPENVFIFFLDKIYTNIHKLKYPTIYFCFDWVVLFKIRYQARLNSSTLILVKKSQISENFCNDLTSISGIFSQTQLFSLRVLKGKLLISLCKANIQISFDL